MIAADNGTIDYLLEEPRWPESVDLAELNRQASLLSDEEADLFASGEDSERSRINEKYSIGLLDSFLNEAFDGDYRLNFWMF